MDKTTIEPIFVSGAIKGCPTCGKELEANATTCPTCGTRFEVYTRAYCTHCHQLIHATPEGKCPNCQGSHLLDARMYSTLIAAGTLSAQPAAGEKPTEAVIKAKPMEKPAPQSDTKKCPVCAETIKAEARLCRFCRARFDVAVKGYCMNCHTEVTPDAKDKCPNCGSAMIGRHVASTLLSVPSAGTSVQTPVAHPADPASIQVQPDATTATFTPALATQEAPLGPKPHMSLWQLYFSPKGCICRLTFFKGILSLLGICFVVGLILGLIISLSSNPAKYVQINNTTTPFIVFSMITFLWIWFMLLTKRLHDINRSGWNIFYVLIPVIGQLIYLGLIIACFFRKGTGPNKYGTQSA